MLKQVKLAEIAGKTVAKVGTDPSDRTVVLAFADGTFLLLEAVMVYEDPALCEEEFSPLDHEHAVAGLRAGAVTPEEVEAARAAARASRKRDEEEYERQQLAKLKARYEKE